MSFVIAVDLLYPVPSLLHCRQEGHCLIWLPAVDNGRDLCQSFEHYNVGIGCDGFLTLFKGIW